jgi:predicted HicB family RNase H-like nuclease
MVTYKGYVGRVDYDENARSFFGTVVNANVLISFCGKNVDEIEESFHDVVDTYLEDCQQSGEDPQKPFSGKIVVRLSPDIHRRVMIKAASRRESMNQFIGELLERETADLEAP